MQLVLWGVDDDAWWSAQNATIILSEAKVLLPQQFSLKRA